MGGGCLFVPPPPLPEELEASKVASAGTGGGETPGEAGGAASAGQGAGEEGGAAGPGDGGSGSLDRFKKGDPPEIGMTEAEIYAYNAAQGDPLQGPFPLEQALAGIPGEGELWVEFVTERGVIDCRLEEELTPNTVANFAALVQGLRPVMDPETGEWLPRRYFDGTVFHRVIPGFMVQGGDPTGTGYGNPGYVVPDELHPELRHDQAGVLSMANKGLGTGSAQFFITLGPTPHLDGKHTIFGRCSEQGVDIADDIAMVPRGPNDKPDEPEVIQQARLVRRPAAE